MYNPMYAGYTQKANSLSRIIYLFLVITKRAECVQSRRKNKDMSVDFFGIKDTF